MALSRHMQAECPRGQTGHGEHLKCGSRGKWIRRSVLTLLYATVVTVLMAPTGVSALEQIVEDDENDVPVFWDAETGATVEEPLSGNSCLSRIDYLDMICCKLSLDPATSVYTLWMEVSGGLPVEGDALPSGIKIVEWGLWIEDGVWNPYFNPITPYFLVALAYDGTSYDAYVLDCQTNEIAMSLEDEDFWHAGAELQFSFPTDSIGDPESFNWMTSTRVWCGQPDTYGYRFTDMTDWDACPGDEGYDLTWPP